MAHPVQCLRTQLRILKQTSSLRPPTNFSHPTNLQPITSADQLRFKSSTRQTGGGKGKSTKTNENRSAQTKGYLKKPKSNAGGADGKTDRYEAIKQMLYDQDPDVSDTTRFRRLKAIIPEIQIHETIDRAWKLHKRYQREKQEEVLEKQYQSMNRALEELRQTDINLYIKVIKDENGSTYRLQNIVQNVKNEINLNSTGKLLGLFPRQIKLPTESLPSHDKVWDLDWKNPVNPLS